jgi:hypothetical protein
LVEWQAVQSRWVRNWFCAILVLGCVSAPASAAPSSASTLTRLESAYAEFNDAAGVVGLIDSDPARHAHGYGGRSRASWVALYRGQRAQLLHGLRQLGTGDLSTTDRRAVLLMQEALTASAAAPASPAPTGHCEDAQRRGSALRAQQQALYACFVELGNRLSFENVRVTRVDALALLSTMPEPARRRALFMAFQPLWHALNGSDEPDSPYRRMIRQAATHPTTDSSPIELAARTVEVPVEETERWLVSILDAWRQVSGDSAVEPWDFRFQANTGVSALSELIPVDGMQQLNQRYYADLGLDLARAGVIYDLQPRIGKAPLAYSDFVIRGRLQEDTWQPTIARVSASYAHGSLGELNELVHENGHAAHMLALRTRPAFMDLGDPLFYEAFADVPSWSVYEPRWQLKYLGRSASESDSMRALYAGVILDAAWALFDLRMLRHPDTDPNQLWTDITQRYLHIRPHPGFSWWAMRVQLVDVPGYMVNYGLGSVITADLRERIERELGPFQTGEPRWFAWLGQNLLASGEEHPSTDLLRKFLGRPVSPDALLRQLRRVSPVQAAAAIP